VTLFLVTTPTQRERVKREGGSTKIAGSREGRPEKKKIIK